jgi:hypothetical protein
VSAAIIDLSTRRRRPQGPDESEIIAGRIRDTFCCSLKAILRGEYEQAAATAENARRDILRACEAPTLIADMGTAETERQYVRRLLGRALDAWRCDDLTGALSNVNAARLTLERLLASGISEDDERREIPKRARRLRAAIKAAETRRRNRAKRR